MRQYQRHFITGCWILAALATPAFAAEGTYTLKNQFKQDQTVYLTIDNSITGTSSIGANQIPIRINMDMEFDFTTREIDSQGDALIDVKINRLDMYDEQFGPQKIDLAEKMDAKNNTLRVKIDPFGKSLDLPSGSSGNPLSLQGMGGMAQSNPVRLPWPQMPDRPVAVGETWHEQYPVPMMGATKPIIADATYTLTGVEEKNGEQIARISKQTNIYAQNVTLDPKATGQNTGIVTIKVVFREYSAKGTGILDFNITRGRMEALEDALDVVIDMGGETNVQQAAFPNEVLMKCTTTMKGTFSETKPVPAAPAEPVSTATQP